MPAGMPVATTSSVSHVVYLQNPAVSDVLIEGITRITLTRPRDPVQALGRFLLQRGTKIDKEESQIPEWARRAKYTASQMQPWDEPSTEEVHDIKALVRESDWAARFANVIGQPEAFSSTDVAPTILENNATLDVTEPLAAEGVLEVTDTAREGVEPVITDSAAKSEPNEEAIEPVATTPQEETDVSQPIETNAPATSEESHEITTEAPLEGEPNETAETTLENE